MSFPLLRGFHLFTERSNNFLHSINIWIMYISFLILSSSSGLILKDDYEERTDSSLSFLQRY